MTEIYKLLVNCLKDYEDTIKVLNTEKYPTVESLKAYLIFNHMGHGLCWFANSKYPDNIYLFSDFYETSDISASFSWQTKKRIYIELPPWSLKTNAEIFYSLQTRIQYMKHCIAGIEAYQKQFIEDVIKELDNENT